MLPGSSTRLSSRKTLASAELGFRRLISGGIIFITTLPA